MKTSKFFTAILFVFSFFALNLHSDPGGMFKQIDTEPGSVGSYEMARMELEEGIIHTAWMSKAGDSSPEKVTYRRSTDNGKTFETPIDAIIPDEELTGLKQGTLKLEVNGDNVYISVLGGTTANGGWSEGLFFAKSNDGGKTFTKPKMLTEAKQYYKIDMVDMRIDGSAIYILTEERFNPDSYGKILIFKSTDNGDSFEQIIVEEAVDIHSKELLVQNGEIHILLYKSHYYYGFRWGILSMATSMDGGNIFNITEISEVVPDDENHRAMLDYDECTENRLMAKENDVLYVLWHEIPVKDGERCMMLSKSSDNGSSFTNKKVTGYGVDDVTGLGSIFDLKVKENNVNILQRRGGSGSMSHWLVHSSDGGNNFDAIKQIDVGWSFSNRGYGGFHSDFAEIISDNNDMLAIGLSPGRIRISYDGGKTFDKGFMLTEHYHALMNYNTSKFIYTDDAIYIIGYDRGSEKGIRFGKIELEEISENPDVNKSVKIANDAKFVHANICESPGLLDNSPSQFSISFWFKYECAEGEEGNTREIIRKHSEYQPVFNLQMIKGGLRGSIKTDKEFLHTEKGGTVVANKWQHYALTYNADGIDPNLIVYLDGIPVAEAFTTGNLLNEAGTILFGTTKNNDEDIYYYDDLNIWDRALSPKEIKDVALNSIQNVDKTSLLYYSDFNGSMYDAEHDIQAIALSAEYSDDVANPPNVDFSAVLNGFELLCINKTQNAENSHWDFDDGNTSDLANPTNVYKKYGEYNVSLTTENETTVFSAYLPTTVEGLAEIDKKKGTNNGSITIRLFGGGLGENDDFSLRTSSGKIIEPIMHTNPEAGVVEAIFDLSGQDPSICDVVAEVSGKEQVLEDAFEIIQADPDFKYELWIELHGRGAAIFNLWQTYTIVMGNNSDIDAYAVPFGLAISDFPGTEVEFMDFEIETPERAGYEFPTEIADLPLYAVLDEVNGEKLNARVYPFIIPVIPANSTISMRIRVKSPEDLSMRGWLMEPIVEYVGEGGITKQKDDELTNQAKADLAKCLIKVIGVGAIDIGTAAIPGVGCAWAVGKNLYNTYQDPPKTEKKVWSFVYDWSVTMFDCGVNLSGIGNVYSAAATFFANMYGYAKQYNDCIEQGVKSGAIKDVGMISSFDPNEITGPSGFGNEGFIQPQKKLPYTIYFENIADATAPAHIVTVIDTLNEMYSRDNFTFGAFGFGDKVYYPSMENQYSFAQDIQIDEQLLLRVSGEYDIETGIITWLFQSLDPLTMDIHEDPMTGFLPPNVNSPEGEGFVSYTAYPLSTPIDGEIYTNRAAIVFDANEQIITNAWINTIDEIEPESRVSNLDITSSQKFVVDWSGSDAGAGVYYYDVYVSIDDGEFIPWLLQTRDTQAEFNGEKSVRYSYYSIATDKAGNIEYNTGIADASTTITSVYNEMTDKIVIYPNPADEFLTIDLAGLEGNDIFIEIFSTSAGKVFEDEYLISEGKAISKINTSGFNSGVYFVKFTLKDEVFYKNFVIIRDCR